MIRHLLKLAWNRKRQNALVMIEITISFIVLFTVVAFATLYANNYRRPLGFDLRHRPELRVQNIAASVR